jgi:hypothetical protein
MPAETTRELYRAYRAAPETRRDRDGKASEGEDRDGLTQLWILSNVLLPTPPVATRFSRFRQFVDRFRRKPVKIQQKIGKISQKRTK